MNSEIVKRSVAGWVFIAITLAESFEQESVVGYDSAARLIRSLSDKGKDSTAPRVTSIGSKSE
jgi:hypothetical protein